METVGYSLWHHRKNCRYSTAFEGRDGSISATRETFSSSHADWFEWENTALLLSKRTDHKLFQSSSVFSRTLRDKSENLVPPSQASSVSLVVNTKFWGFFSLLFFLLPLLPLHSFILSSLPKKKKEKRRENSSLIISMISVYVSLFFLSRWSHVFILLLVESWLSSFEQWHFSISQTKKRREFLQFSRLLSLDLPSSSFPVSIQLLFL